VKRAASLALILAACGTTSSTTPTRSSARWQVKRADHHPPDVTLVVDGQELAVGRVSEDAEGDACHATASSNALTCGTDRGYDTFAVNISDGELVVKRHFTVISEGDGPISDSPQEVARMPTSLRELSIAPFDDSSQQSLRTALKIICRSPEEIPSDARGDRRDVEIGKFVDARVSNAEARQMFAKLGTLSPGAKQMLLREAVARVALPECAMLAELPAPVRIRCDAEIEIHCPPGYENGCGGDRTSYHACVPVGAVAAAPCETEIVQRCAPGEQDSCSADPPFGSKHVCVRSR